MLSRIKLRYKILSIPLLVVILACLAMIFIGGVIGKNESILNEMADNALPAWETSHGILEDLAAIQGALESALILRRTERVREAEAIYQNLQVRIQGQSDRAAAHLAGLSEMIEEYFTLAKRVTQEQIRGRSREEVSDVLESMQNQYGNIQEHLRLINHNHMESMQTTLEMAQSQNRKSKVAIFSSVLIIIPLIFGMAFFILSNITGPLRQLIEISEQVAEGDMTVQIAETTSGDEIGFLTQKMGKMISNLRVLTVQIKEAANSLAAASSEISASVTQIASGATETATAANETSTTVEEVRQTALDSSRKAKFVSESAQKAVQISQNGEKAVSVMVEGMQRIESQMVSIAESIMKLSEHGQAIGGIIATVEDVAEQSNLLAVNASIEAAKAGEQGKGFAVVAMEVKSLAEQSRQATVRVRSILDDIQKATGGAVMVTEQGSKAVDSGVQMSSNASDSIQRLANSVTEAAQATTQIAVSSQEQLVGMDQVVSAMESIKQASTQNVTATKQVESAAHDLHELGQNLKHLVEQYRV
ncbi:MAG TPA: methyl-accepting chemotaxis protein [bacterium]|nr:methyl-accepting chemotaxis protein [bacterium]